LLLRNKAKRGVREDSDDKKKEMEKAVNTWRGNKGNG
jgi:hypothetical protein